MGTVSQILQRSAGNYGHQEAFGRPGVLVRSELQLARQELAEKAKTAGVGAGMVGGSALTGLMTLGSLTALLILAISLVLAPWLAALIVTIVWGAITAILALVGKRKI